MKIYRIIDKETKLFIRDDFEYNEEIEIGLDVEPSQGLFQPKWNGQEWVEGATQEYIDGLKAQVEIEVEPTLDEINRADIDYLAIMMEVDL